MQATSKENLGLNCSKLFSFITAVNITGWLYMLRSYCFHVTNRIRTFIVTATTKMSPYRGNTKSSLCQKVADVLCKMTYHATLLFQILFRVHHAVKQN